MMIKWGQGAETMFNYASSAFKEGELSIKVWPGKHIFNQEMRNYAYAFLNKHLSKSR